jgi:hypothetical protein
VSLFVPGDLLESFLFEENENLLICNDTELLSIKGVEIGV